MLQKVLRVLTDTCLLVFVIHPKHNVLFIPETPLREIEILTGKSYFSTIIDHVDFKKKFRKSIQRKNTT